MATAYAKRALQKLTEFKSTKWFTKDFKTMAIKIAKDYASRNEINYGLANLAVDTHQTSTFKLTGAAGECVINGVIRTLPALADTDVAPASAAGNVLGAITAAGAELGGFDSSATVQYVTLLATNSDGSGAQADTDGANIKYVAVVDTGDHLTSVEIANAIAASEDNGNDCDHSGCSYVMVAQGIGNLASAHAVTLNRNNVLGA